MVNRAPGATLVSCPRGKERLTLGGRLLVRGRRPPSPFEGGKEQG